MARPLAGDLWRPAAHLRAKLATGARKLNKNNLKI
jgi:hypothetical protein